MTRYLGYSFIDPIEIYIYIMRNDFLPVSKIISYWKNVFHECTLFWKSSTFKYINEDVNVSLEDDFCVTNRPAKYNILYSAKLHIGRNNCFIV